MEKGRLEDGTDDGGFRGKAGEWEVGFSPENDRSDDPIIPEEWFWLESYIDIINLQKRSIIPNSHRDPMFVLMELD